MNPSCTATDFDADSLAQQLVDAHTTLRPVAKPASMSKSQATLVKQKAFELLSAHGQREVVGYKVSMSCTWGALTADRVLRSPARLPRNGVFDPLVETEAVLLLDADIDADASIEHIVAHSRVAAGIEVADSRWCDWCPSIPERFVKPNGAEIEADNALSGWMIIGSSSVPAASLPLPHVSVSAAKDGSIVASGSLTYVMGHPAQVVRWLAQSLAASNLRLRAGDFVSTGNPYKTYVTAQTGSTYEAIIEGVGTAALTFY